MMSFEWDAAKASTNLQKHQVSFETAVRVFADPFAITKQDRVESGETRWQTLGVAEGFLLLLVAHTSRENKDGTEVVRLISARRADKQERKLYEQSHSP